MKKRTTKRTCSQARTAGREMLKQVTKWDLRKNLSFAIENFKRYNAPFKIKRQGGLCAIFVVGEPNNQYPKRWCVQIKRKCLKCLKPFISFAGDSHLCKECRKLNEAIGRFGGGVTIHKTQKNISRD